MDQFHGTTIVSVRDNNQVAIGGFAGRHGDERQRR